MRHQRCTRGWNRPLKRTPSPLTDSVEHTGRPRSCHKGCLRQNTSGGQEVSWLSSSGWSSWTSWWTIHRRGCRRRRQRRPRSRHRSGLRAAVALALRRGALLSELVFAFGEPGSVNGDTGSLRRLEELELATHFLGHCLRDAGVATRPRRATPPSATDTARSPPTANELRVAGLTMANPKATTDSWETRQKPLNR